jgi:hypothetical protein
VARCRGLSCWWCWAAGLALRRLPYLVGCEGVLCVAGAAGCLTAAGTPAPSCCELRWVTRVRHRPARNAARHSASAQCRGMPGRPLGGGCIVLHHAAAGGAAERSLISSLVGLGHALGAPAWLSVFKAPWCWEQDHGPLWCVCDVWSLCGPVGFLYVPSGTKTVFWGLHPLQDLQKGDHRPPS